MKIVLKDSKIVFKQHAKDWGLIERASTITGLTVWKTGAGEIYWFENSASDSVVYSVSSGEKIKIVFNGTIFHSRLFAFIDGNDATSNIIDVSDEYYGAAQQEGVNTEVEVVVPYNAGIKNIVIPVQKGQYYQCKLYKLQ